MAITCSEQRKGHSGTRNQRKRKRKQKKTSNALSVKREDSTGIDELPDEILINILSCMSLKEAIRTSVFSRRWRYLWMFKSGTLDFDDRDSAAGTIMRGKTFEASVNRVLKLHQGLRVDSLIIRFRNSRAPSHSIDNWIHFAKQREVEKFELDLSGRLKHRGFYEFPRVEKFSSRSHEVKSAFGSLRSLRLVDVHIKDEVVHYFLASCPYLERLCISTCSAPKKLKIIDPLPNLKVLEISQCFKIKSLEISAANLVSFTYDGREISLPFKRVPNLSDLTLGGQFCRSFICEPNKHSSYSVQLLKLSLKLKISLPARYPASRDLPQLYSLKHLELDIVAQVGRRLFIFSSLIKGSPLLEEFRIKLRYMVCAPWFEVDTFMMFPIVMADRFYHKNLKVIEVAGYIGCMSDEEFVLHLFEVAPSSLEMVTIDTESEYYEQELWDCSTMCNKAGAPHRCSCRRQCDLEREGLPCDCDRLREATGARTRAEAKQRAKCLELSCPPEAIFIVK